MNNTFDITLIRNIAIAYFGIGVVVCLLHPKIIRDHIVTLKDLDLGNASVFRKPAMAFLAFGLACIFWPIAWWNVGKSEKKARQATDVQLERLRPFAQIYSAMNAPVRYAGGDGSSIEQAVILVGATVLSGPRAERDFIERRYPFYEFRKQSLKEQNGRNYDVLEFTTAEGETKRLYFDISAHLGQVRSC
jgi:hypothetical protein